MQCMHSRFPVFRFYSGFIPTVSQGDIRNCTLFSPTAPTLSFNQTRKGLEASFKQCVFDGIGVDRENL